MGLISDILLPFFILAVIIVLVAFSNAIFDFGLYSGSGNQIGYISEVETNGMFYHQPTVHLISINPVYSNSDTSWQFGLDNPDLVTNATDAMNSHEPVVVYYKSYYFVWRSQFATRDVIISINPTNQTKGND